MSDIFREVLRGFEKDKAAAHGRLSARHALLYEKMPRVKEIDARLSEIGRTLALMVLKRDGDEAKRQLLKAESLGLTNEKDGLLYENGYDEDFFTDIYKCGTCQDTGFVGGVQCNCLKQRLIGHYFEMSDLVKVADHGDFDTFNMAHYSDMTDPDHGISPRANMERIFSIALAFTRKFDTEFENLLFYGSTGLGKTYLSNCIAREMLDKGRTVLYTSATQLFRHVEDLRFGRDPSRSAAILNTAYEAELLIIDDLGTEFITTVTTAELFNFINTRLLKKKHTIISTNLSPNDLAGIYTDRITSRIYGEYTLLNFFGEDIRVGKKHGMMQ
ncbi:MAG: ATP-binding protein [Defluviitaleaceae bacterium]|nr:ATP-binding protein [Defluviitaleaceae bacterium]